MKVRGWSATPFAGPTGAFTGGVWTGCSRCGSATGTISIVRQAHIGLRGGRPGGGCGGGGPVPALLVLLVLRLHLGHLGTCAGSYQSSGAVLTLVAPPKFSIA